MALYAIYNSPSPTTAKRVAVTTGTAIKTLLQVKSSTTKPMKVVEWGISFSGSAAATGIPTSLIETGTVFATVTAHVTAGIVRFDAEAVSGGDPVTDLIPVGTSATGYTSTAEGSITTTRNFDHQLIQPTGQYVKQFPLGREPYIAVASSLRIRTHAAAAVDAVCYVIVEV